MMTKQPEHFIRPDEAVTEPLLYKGCGLEGIYLSNGYEVEEIDGQKYTIIKDREELHSVIALNLVEHRKTLSPAELRFIRIAMDETQASLGEALGVSSQTVARWEKGESSFDGPADRMIRIMMMIKMLPHEELVKLEKMLSQLLDEMDESNVVPLQFRHDIEWKEAA
jgi:DNA-binding transcriptional regulator YiaG